jgi:SHS2 domain-containing protein
VKKYELIEHTADIGIRVFGKTKEDIFTNAAYAMFDIMAASKTIDSTCLPSRIRHRQEQEHSLTIKAADTEELLISFLNELIYFFVSKEFLPAKFKIVKMNSQSLVALVSGEKFDLKRHRIKTEIKAATYHNLKIEKNVAGYQAEVIFDA